MNQKYSSFSKTRVTKPYHIAIFSIIGIVAVLSFRLSTATIEAPPTFKTIPLSLPQTDQDSSSPSISGKAGHRQYKKNQASQPQTHQSDWITTSVQDGDNLFRIFSRFNLNTAELYALLSSCQEGEALAQLRPGQTIKIRSDADGKLLELIYEPKKFQQRQFVRHGTTFKSFKLTPSVEKRIVFSSGTISHSFYQTAVETGLPDSLIMELVDIFRWDIDFALNIRAGDSFIVIYESLHADGEKIGNGRILAAEFSNAGKTHRTVRYTNAQGESNYYTPDGRSMRQTFLRAPVDFRRISSHFQKARYHPILGKKRPHKGVDYAAPTGTQIWAAGDGTVEFIGTKGGYGKTIILKHDENHTTLYGHMSRFHESLEQGSRVRQGDVIGYVGMTGLATGPHLHYEFRIDGKHMDPVKVELPRPVRMTDAQLEAFRSKTASLMAQLDTYRKTRFVMLDKP